MLPLRCQRRSSGPYALPTYPVRRDGEGTCLFYGVAEDKPCNYPSTPLHLMFVHRDLSVRVSSAISEVCLNVLSLNEMDDEIIALLVISFCVGFCYWVR